MRVGFGIWDITPRVGVDLYGFGPYINRRAKAVYEPLEARASAFEAEDGARFLLIVCDLCVLQVNTADLVRSIVCEKVKGLTPASVWIQCTHTHSGPSTDPQDMGWGAPDATYMEILPWRIAQAGIQAFENLEEGHLSSAWVECRHIGLNRVYDRDAPPLADVLQPDWEPEKPELTDTKCQVIRFDNLKGEMKGFWAYYGCHPVVCTADSCFIHGDYPGVAMHALMADFPGSVGIFLLGAHGDINSGCVHKLEAESMAALPIFAGRFASAVRKGLKAATPMADEGIHFESMTIPVTMRMAFSRDHIIELLKELESKLHRPDASDGHAEWNGIRLDQVEIVGLRIMLQKMDKWGNPPAIDTEVCGVRIGDWEMLGAPFEIMQGIKNDVWKSSNHAEPMVMSIVNGCWGYAPDRVQLQNDTYEVLTDAFMNGRMPFANVHDELLSAFLELDGKLK